MRKAMHYIGIGVGVLAPTVELSLRLCRSIFFDPLPTIIHIVIFYLAPVSLLVARHLLSEPYTESRDRKVRLCLSYAFLVSLAYSLWFLPISWICLLGLVYMAIGLPGLAPYVLLTVTLSLHGEWKSWAPESCVAGEKARWAKSALLVIPLLVVLWWQPIAIITGEKLLESDNAAKKYAGLFVLDNLVSDEAHRWRCFEVNTRNFFGLPLDPELLSEAYYYIHGVRPGLVRTGTGLWGRPQWEFDEDQGATNIGKRLDGLFLAESTLDAIVRTEEGYAYWEWTMVFENNGALAREARAAIQLPANAVVSKASLWIDGEERDAAFGATSQVKSVYRDIVTRRMDPFLVTMIGPDQVQIQCFPVPLIGEMKIRVGVTCPLREGNILAPPHFIETNFTISESLEHQVWVEADTPGHATIARSDEIDTSLVLSFTDNELSQSGTYFTFDCESPSVYTFGEGTYTLTRTATQDRTVAPILVVDGRSDIRDALSEVRLANDQFSSIIVAQPFGFEVWDGIEDANRFISRNADCGGVNPSPALVEAARKSLEHKAPIVWFHGALPVHVRQDLALEQILRRTDGLAPVTTLAVSGNINSLISDMSSMRYFSPYPPTGDIEADIRGVLRSAQTQYIVGSEQTLLGGRNSSGLVFDGTAAGTASHPYRLYLYSKIMEQWYKKGRVDEDGIEQAVYYRIVTPATGAVVLESKSQYVQSNLDPSVGEQNIPTIPEPEFYILLGLSLLVIVILLFRRRASVCRVSL